MRTLLVTGAGGAGRTTVAAAAAAAAALAGVRTLLLTPDPGPAALPRPAAGEAADGYPADGGFSRAGRGRAAAGPVPLPAVAHGHAAAVDGVPGLWAARIDPGASFQAAALDLQVHLGSLLDLLGAAPLDPEELTALPGAGPLAHLRALRAAHGEGGVPPWELVVMDLPVVRDALALLALPEQLRRYLRRLLPADRQAARALRPVLAQLAGVPMPAEWAYEAAARADDELAGAQAAVDDAGTAVAVVVEPGEQAAQTVRTARTGLALHGLRPAGVVANRLLPTGSADPFLAALSGRQQEHLKALADQCAVDGVPLHELPHLGREPRSAEDLAALAVPVPHPAPGRSAAEPWSVEDRLAADGHFVWSLPLPGASRDGLDLVRRGDELVVDAGGFRRIMPLPSALRRCTVSGAALRDGVLRVRFVPDPDLWPQ